MGANSPRPTAPAGCGNPVPGMEAGAQPWRGPKPRKRRASPAGAGAGADGHDRPPARQANRAEDRTRGRTCETEL